MPEYLLENLPFTRRIRFRVFILTNHRVLFRAPYCHYCYGSLNRFIDDLFEKIKKKKSNKHLLFYLFFLQNR